MHAHICSVTDMIIFCDGRELSIELQKSELERADVEQKRKRLESDLNYERFVKQEEENKDALIQDLQVSIMLFPVNNIDRHRALSYQ